MTPAPYVKPLRLFCHHRANAEILKCFYYFIGTSLSIYNAYNISTQQKKKNYNSQFFQFYIVENGNIAAFVEEMSNIDQE